MPSKTRASKRKRSDEQPEEQPRTSPKLPKSRREQQQVPAAQQPPEKDLNTQPFDSSAGRLTRHQAQALGKRPISAQEEPERYLQQKARQQARTARREQRDQMERRPGSGGGPRRVSAFFLSLPSLLHLVDWLFDVV
jgi:hypothetical protein